jgi:vacuolar-type H+-ATPase subunit H
MTQAPIEPPDDERLRQLLEVERRLQNLVRAAKDDASRRIAAARAARDPRLAEARAAADRADAERAQVERAAHEEAQSAVETAHRAVLAAIGSISEARVEDLARWALAEAMDGDGDPA